MNNNKVIALVGGGIFALLALWVVLRFVLMSQWGVGGYYLLGVPIAAITVGIALLTRFGLFHLGQRPGGTTQHWQQPGGQHWQQGGVQPPPYGSAPPPPPPFGSVGSQPAPGYHPPLAYQPPPASPAPVPPFGYQPPPVPQPPAPSVAQRLQELETLRANGAISETEYTAKRQEIISNL
jgi:hypothetical protein